MAAELAGSVAEWVGCSNHFVRFFTAQDEGDLPIVDVVLGEVVKVISAASEHIALPILVIIVGLKNQCAPAVK